MPRWLLAIILAGCAGKSITPDEVAHLKPGDHVKVHVWAPGGPGPGVYVKGTFESQDDQKIYVNDGTKKVEIFKGEIHDDTRDVH